MKDSPSPPAAPDPVVTANAQGAMNKETAIAQANLNRINQNTPYGTIDYQQIGKNSDGTPKFQQNVTLSPAQQQLLDIQNSLSKTYGQTGQRQLDSVQGTLSKPIDYNSAPSLKSTISDDFSGDALRAQKAIEYRQNPELDRQQVLLDSKLANQGITQGSEAWRNATDAFGRQRNDAMNQAILAGNQQQQVGFGQAAQNAQFGNAARQQAIQEGTSLRNQPLNELNALRTGSQVTNPQFNPVAQGTIAAPNYQQAVQNQYQGQLNNYNAQVGANNSATSGLFGLGGALGSAWITSDKRLKKNIIPLGVNTQKGFPLYRFEYIDKEGMQTGVMAQDVELTMPEAVITMPTGFKAVNYDMVL